MLYSKITFRRTAFLVKQQFFSVNRKQITIYINIYIYIYELNLLRIKPSSNQLLNVFNSDQHLLINQGISTHQTFATKIELYKVL